MRQPAIATSLPIVRVRTARRSSGARGSATSDMRLLALPVFFTFILLLVGIIVRHPPDPWERLRRAHEELLQAFLHDLEDDVDSFSSWSGAHPTSRASLRVLQGEGRCSSRLRRPLLRVLPAPER